MNTKKIEREIRESQKFLNQTKIRLKQDLKIMIFFVMVAVLSFFVGETWLCVISSCAVGYNAIYVLLGHWNIGRLERKLERLKTEFDK